MPDERCWTEGQLTVYGLATVRRAFPKKVNDADFFRGMVPGRNMGALMVVNLPSDKETRLAIGGPPSNDGNRNLTGGGIKTDMMRIELDLFHMSQVDYTDDAVDDFNGVIEAVKQQIRLDRTLGSIVTEAGESPLGIQSQVGRPGLDPKNRIGIFARIAFEARTQFVA